MRYNNDNSVIQLGDRVIVEDGVHGVVVCDFDSGACLSGYESWMTGKELVGGGKLSSGLMIETKEMGLVHYASDDLQIVKAAAE